MRENTAVNVEMTRLLPRSPQKVVGQKQVCASHRSASLHTILFFQAPRQVRLTTKLNNVAATEGKDAIFKCAVTPADASVRWFHKSLPVAAGIKYKMEHSGNCHTLTVTSVSQQDAGEISFDAEGKSCTANLQVQRKSIGVM